MKVHVITKFRDSNFSQEEVVVWGQFGPRPPTQKRGPIAPPIIRPK